MATSREYIPSPQQLKNPTGNDYADMHRLVGQLSSRERSLEAVTANVQRAVESPNTTVLVVRDPEQESRIQGTATVNVARTHRGPDAWIDDVVTDESVRGQGFSKELMRIAEAIANLGSDEVRLTSSATREVARTGYANRGYQLVTESLYRNTTLQQTPVPGVDKLAELRKEDVDGIAKLLNQDPAITGHNLKIAQESPTSSLFVVRGVAGAIHGVATSYVCPIPVGYKAWVQVDAPEASDAAVLMAAAEYDLPPEAMAMNTTFKPPVEAEDYKMRDSGLYTLAMSGPALAARQWQEWQNS